MTDDPGSRMEAQISSLVTQVVLENTGHRVELGIDDPLVGDGYLDSMTMVSLIIALQSEFGVVLELGDMSVPNFDSVRAIAELLRSRLG